MKNYKLKGTKGFTLLELVLVITLLGIIAGPITAYLTNSYVQSLREERRTQLISSAKAALEKIVEDMRSSKTVRIYKDTPTSEITLAESAGGEIGNIIECEDSSYWNPTNDPAKTIWFRMRSASEARILRYQNTDGSLTGVDDNTNTLSDNISGFAVSIISVNNNVTLYKIKLDMAVGNGSNRVTASVDTNCAKYKTPY